MNIHKSTVQMFNIGNRTPNYSNLIQKILLHIQQSTTDNNRLVAHRTQQSHSNYPFYENYQIQLNSN